MQTAAQYVINSHDIRCNGIHVGTTCSRYPTLCGARAPAYQIQCMCQRISIETHVLISCHYHYERTLHTLNGHTRSTGTPAAASSAPRIYWEMNYFAHSASASIHELWIITIRWRRICNFIFRQSTYTNDMTSLGDLLRTKRCSLRKTRVGEREREKNVMSQSLFGLCGCVRDVVESMLTSSHRIFRFMRHRHSPGQ